MKLGKFLPLLLSLFIMNQVFTRDIETDSFQTKTGETVTVHFIEHASLYFTYTGLTIYSDPVKYAGVDYKMLPKADVILITHDHYDHFDKEIIETISTPKTKIFCNAAVFDVLQKGIELANGYVVHSVIDIEVVPAYNITDGRDIYHPKYRDNGYIITLGGTRIYIPGDCEYMPEMNNFKDVDVAFLPINQPYTMTVAQAILAATVIKPKILYPIHYSDTDLEGLSVLKIKGIDVRIFKM